VLLSEDCGEIVCEGPAFLGKREMAAGAYANARIRQLMSPSAGELREQLEGLHGRISTLLVRL
jgi:hypothetical protein